MHRTATASSVNRSSTVTGTAGLERPTMPAQKGYLCWLGEYEDNVYYIYKDTTSVSVFRIENGSDNVVFMKQVSCEKIPPIWNVAYDASTKKIWVVGKDSLIYCDDEAGTAFELYDSGNLYPGGTIYADIHVCGEHVCAADLGLARVIDVVTGQEIVTPDDGYAVYRVYEDGQKVYCADQIGLMIADRENGITYYDTVVKFSQDFMFKCNLVYASYVYILLVIVIIAFLILFATFRSSKSGYKKTGVFVALTVALSSAIISIMILSDTFTRLSDSSYNELLRTAEIVSRTSSINGLGDALKDIDGTEDYGGESYRYIKDRLDIYCDAAYDNGGNMYYVIYKFDDDLVWGVIDYEDTTGTVYPYMPYADSYYEEVVNTGRLHLEAASVDAYGAWSYACGPIYDSEGNIAGLIEFGVNMMSENQANQKLITDIIIRTAVIVLIIVLAIVEGTSLSEGIHGFRKEKDPNMPYFLRPMIFLTFLASNLSAAFIPQLSLKIYQENGLEMFDGSFAAALPMSLQLFATAISAYICGKLLEKFKMRSIMLLSGIIQIIGYVCIALAVPASDYMLFSAGHFVSGLGIGLIIVSLNALPDQVENVEKRNGYYTSLNAGVIAGVVFGCSVGTYLAGGIGYANTFVVSIVIVLVVMFLTFISIGQGKHAVPKNTEPEFPGDRRKGMTTIRFLFRKDVFFFIICVMMPMLIMLYFKDYLFPLYANESGIQDTDIGNVILFAGAVSIVCGPTISDWLLKHVGTEGVIAVSSSLICGSLIVFGFIPSYELSVAIVFILSLVTGFGLGAQEIYYSSLKEFKRYGAQRAMSIYSIFDNISQTAGPLIMGALLFMGYGGECFTMGLAGLGLYGIFLLIRLHSRVKGKVKNNDTISETHK